MTSTLPTNVDPVKSQDVLDGRWDQIRLDAREHLGDPSADVMSFDLPGCFAMTETGRGSQQDAEVRLGAEGRQASKESATDLEAAPAH